LHVQPAFLLSGFHLHLRSLIHTQEHTPPATLALLLACCRCLRRWGCVGNIQVLRSFASLGRFSRLSWRFCLRDALRKRGDDAPILPVALFCPVKLLRPPFYALTPSEFPRIIYAGNLVSEKNSSRKLAEQAGSRALVSPQLICEQLASLHERG